jgi:hypothetical protein
VEDEDEGLRSWWTCEHATVCSLGTETEEVYKFPERFRDGKSSLSHLSNLPIIQTSPSLAQYRVNMYSTPEILVTTGFEL